ncbi:MAG TPA: S9 family peptidase [Gemmatimonadales bacterium]|jgi:dipeptidyl aminopeptidase/acylaminoacyl peptidase|nr:S9 family peptidase [Gemmatimonadales bacterium]
MCQDLARVALALTLLLCWTAAHAQDSATISPNENLVTDGVPPIPAAIAQAARRYTESRSASLLDWHPARREILISTRFANTPQIHRVVSPGGARTQLTFAEEPVSQAVYEPRTGRYFLFLKDAGGNEFSQIYRFDLPGGEITLLTDGRSQNGGIEWSTAGDRIAYGSTRRNGTDRDIYVMNPADPKTDRLLLQVQGGGWGVTDWSADDRTLIAEETRSVTQSSLWLVDVTRGEKSPLMPADTGDTAVYSAARFSRDGRGVYLITDQGSEFRRLAFMDLTSRRITPLTPRIDWDVDQFELSWDGSTIAFVANEEGVSRLYLLDTRTRRIRSVPGLASGIISGLVWQRGGGRLGFTLVTTRSPGDAYSLDPGTGKLTRWTESETGGLDTSVLPTPALIRWPSFDGRQISGFYSRPPARFSGKRPVVINIHGGPEGQARPGFLGRSNYLLNELGVAIIAPNVRGSTGYGKSFVKLDNGVKREDTVKDIGALLDWIGRQPELDGSRVMVTGGSYGGYMTLMVATTYNDRICCSLDVVGISNLATFLAHTESYRRDLRRVEYGDERDPETRAFMERTAPANNAAKITKPLFVVQGANDPRVPRSEAEQMVATVKRNANPVWYLLAKDEGHGFRKKANADFQFYASVEFIRNYLLGEGGAHP